jgi:alpha-ketoglutarate-dependent taurine dioxygenase
MGPRFGASANSQWDGRIESLDTNGLAREFFSNGYAVVRGPAPDPITAYGVLQNLLFTLGHPQGHERGDANGVTPVHSQPAGDGKAQLYKGLSCDRVEHHTDASYLAHTLDDGSVAVPPDVFLLQCVCPPASGGELELCDWQQVWRTLSDSSDPADAELLAELQRPHFSVERGALARYDFPLLERCSDGVLRLRWHDDLIVSPAFAPKLAAFQQRFLRSPKYIRRLNPASGDILILDNSRVSHGREPFTDDPRAPLTYQRVYLSSELGHRPDAPRAYAGQRTRGDGRVYRRLRRPEKSALTGEAIPAQPVSLTIGISRV